MPSELRPNFKRKLAAKNRPDKLGKIVNVEEAFKALEQKEKTRKPGTAPGADENDSDKVRWFSMEIFFVHRKNGNRSSR